MSRQTFIFILAAYIGVMLLLTSCANFLTPPPKQTEIPWPVVSACEHPPLPDFLECVFPGPGMTVSLQDYNRAMKAPMTMSAGVGVKLNGTKIVENGENLTDEEIQQRPTLLVDQQTVPDNLKRWVIEGLPTKAYNDKGELVYEVDAGPHSAQWLVPLAPGQHQATIHIRKKSGQVLTFSWQFTVKE